MAERGSAARHTFYYLLGLVTMGFTALGVGQILFQVINATFVETTYHYDSTFDQFVLRFGMTALIISAPIFWVTVRAINKELADKRLAMDSLVRKWLTYFILLVTSVTILGVAMGLLYNFLGGELTTKFLLKSLVIGGIAGLIFGYYHYDINRTSFEVNKQIKIFRGLFLVTVIASVVLGGYYIQSPAEARMIREDDERVSRLSSIRYQIEEYYRQNETVPDELEVIRERLYRGDITDPVTDEPFRYEKTANNEYTLCATFAFSNREDDAPQPNYYSWRDPDWLHDAGEECFERTIVTEEPPVIYR